MNERKLTHIIIPTINEHESLKKLIPKLPKDTKIIIVDDGSTDNTDKIDKEIKDHKIKIIERNKKSGIVSAILDGMKYALKDNCDLIATMDADGQHDPNDLKVLLNEAIKSDADLVIGSRYIFGGSAEGFNFIRSLISKSANLLFKINFNLPVKDVTSGYRIYSKRLAKFLVNSNLVNNAYAGQVEIVQKAYEKNFKVVEAPIHFKKRIYGKSKLSLKDILNYLKFILANGPLGKYAIVGVSGIFVNEGVLYFLSRIINPFISDIVSIETSINSNFILNEFWTFKNRKLNKRFPSIMKRAAQHNLSSLLGLAINYAVFAILTFFGINILLSNLIGIIIAFVVRFLLSSLWVWSNNYNLLMLN